MKNAHRVLPLLLALGMPGLARASAEEDAQDLQLSPALRGKMTVCTDGKSHYVAASPDADDNTHYARLYYGDGKTFYLVPRYQSITGIYFHDPRFYNPRGREPEGRRGTDFRLLSQIYLENGACALRCGERKVDLTVVDAQKAAAMMTGAKLEQSPRKWEPYALLRDDTGIYYQVDRGFAPDARKRFRLFVGPKGNLREQKMINIVSDTEGDIFATKTGSLRLVLNRHESNWVEGGKPHPLTIVPVESNLQMIYNELGTYTGDRLGTPCDGM